MSLLNFFIDELGSADRNEKHSDHYILSGCMVNNHSRNFLRIRSDQIKFKYWGKTDVVFHSREIGRKSGIFSILNENKIFNSFKKDLFSFLTLGNYQLFIVALDKKKALKQNWTSEKNYKESANVLIKNFILSLLATNSKGRLVIESATSERDFIFHKVASNFLSSGIPSLNIKSKDIQNVFTEIAFVTKKNFDIEEQIADLLVYGAKLKLKGKKLEQMNDYEKNILKIMNQKLFKMHPGTGAKKKKYYSAMNSFEILP